jgi:hypothetical protein
MAEMIDTLDTVTKPWLEVLDAVNPKTLPRKRLEDEH